MLGNIYPDSKQEAGGSLFYLALYNGVKSLVIHNESDVYNQFSGQMVALENGAAKVCPLSNENANAIRRIFPYTNPSSHAGHPITLGLGDRLGLASPGHLRLIKNMDIFPVLAQQSIRELTLTGRTYADVLDSAVWAVFQEGYTKGYGADGDHLKTADEVKMALDCGFTMITLDCSEHIGNDAATLSGAALDSAYAEIPEPERTAFEQKYAGKTFSIGGGVSISFSPDALKRAALVYRGAIKHTVSVYHDVIKACGRPIDFEMSIDETLSTTLPEAHFFVAYELKEQGVKPASLAPRFCGEFQKGIDYKGDINEFTKEFVIHAKIAEHFGYKLSIHSGSDKFMVFPIIGKETGGVYHLKTAGTNWLEAVRVVAGKAPELFKEIFAFAMENLHEAKKYYHITENTANIPSPDSLAGDKLSQLLDQDDARQVIHVTYGLILLAQKQGAPLFKDRIFEVLRQYEAEYYAALRKHIGRHIEKLNER